MALTFPHKTPTSTGGNGTCPVAMLLRKDLRLRPGWSIRRSRISLCIFCWNIWVHSGFFAGREMDRSKYRHVDGKAWPSRFSNEGCGNSRQGCKGGRCGRGGKVPWWQCWWITGLQAGPGQAGQLADSISRCFFELDRQVFKASSSGCWQTLLIVAAWSVQGVDVLSGVEAVISHMVVRQFEIPCAHAPALAPLPLDASISPRSAAEEA